MTHNEKLVFLIEELLSESSPYRGMKIPEDLGKRKRLLRTLMNIREPKPIQDAFLKIQDEYLQEEVKEKGIVDGETLTPSAADSRLVLWKGDITLLKTDAIVNAANSSLRGCFVPCHSCIDNAIHSASGIQLRLACDDIMVKQGHEEPAGGAKITPSYNLPCRYIIHTVGPIVSGPLKETHCEQLADCYRACLKLAEENKLKSVAFCCISTGEFHFPHRRAAEIAVKTVQEFLVGATQIERVIFNVFQEEDYEIYQEILG
ncbi:MAG: protein-ADP-ribose hydrolase [Lachnospiraceae bacterium]|nr:protein-ADP-ribose hydrolase [Lachnospiraceae bacterium]